MTIDSARKYDYTRKLERTVLVGALMQLGLKRRIIAQVQVVFVLPGTLHRTCAMNIHTFLKEHTDG